VFNSHLSYSRQLFELSLLEAVWQACRDGVDRVHKRRSGSIASKGKQARNVVLRLDVPAGTRYRGKVAPLCRLWMQPVPGGFVLALSVD